ncbi:MAG: pyridoxamine 5'-phosphate oxidase family protein [Oscillospiraceae bacterium]|nr:pyridoxamine 5'-phosphate oxidase family protein [Oscillospiraceae bacterium]
MFRELQRKKQQLPMEECIRILKEEPRGVLSVLGDDGYPYGMPMNHYYSEEDGRIYFHGGRTGHKIDAIRRCNKVSFCVYDQGFRRDGDWALNIRSVVVFGRAEWVEDTETAYRIAAELSRKFTDDEAYIRKEIVRSGPGTLVFALRPEQITGKLVNES